MAKRTMIGGDFILSEEEIEDVTCITLTTDEARTVVDELETQAGHLMDALDQAQADASYKGSARYILIRIR
jgi:hypothetical protein